MGVSNNEWSHIRMDVSMGRCCAALILVSLRCWRAAGEEISFSQESDGSLVGYYNGTLSQSENASFTVPGPSCSRNSFLTVEAWTLDARRSWDTNIYKRMSPFMHVYKTHYDDSLNLQAETRADVARRMQDLDSPYVKFQRQFGSNSTSLRDTWHIILYNENVTTGTRTIDYQLRVSCTALPTCRSPSWLDWYPHGTQAPPCSGFGNCTIVDPSSSNGAKCFCDDYHVGSGCLWNATLFPTNTYQVYTNYKFDLLSGSKAFWKFRPIYDNGSILVSIQRLSGDLLLTLKSNEEGPVPEEVPGMTTLSTYGDVETFQEGTDYSSVMRFNSTATEFYIGIFSFQDRIQQPTSFNLTVVNAPHGWRMCPWGCFGGECDHQGGCTCRNSRAGSKCQGVQFDPISSEEVVHNRIEPGGSHFFPFPIGENPADMKIWYNSSSGWSQTYFVAAWNRYPSGTTHDFLFRPISNTPIEQVISARDMRKGTLWFGIYNVDMWTKGEWSYSLKVTQGKQTSRMSTGELVIIVVTAAGGFIIFFTISCWCLQRYRPEWLPGADRHPTAPGGRYDAQQEGHRRDRGDSRRRRTRRGPLSMHPSGMAMVQQFVFSEADTGNEAQESCPTCLENFEVGQSIHRLPCNHLFHASFDCLERWLVETANECPVCRQRVGVTRLEHRQGGRAVEMVDQRRAPQEPGPQEPGLQEPGPQAQNVEP